MKALMYHYIRPTPSNMDYFPYLHVDDFSKQLDYLDNKYKVLSKSDFYSSIESCKAQQGVILTFDDGFSDHYNYVMPKLIERNMWGCFYIPTSPLKKGKLLDVHRIHLLLGKFGGIKCMALLNTMLKDEMLSHSHIDEFNNLTYHLQNNDISTLTFKRILNYFIAYEWREYILDNLMGNLFSSENEKGLAENFYLSPEQIRLMSEAGMIIGSHTENHFLMSKLSSDEQRKEIKESFETLIEIINKPVNSFCYPYGGFHSFTKETENLLSEAGCLFSFNVESRDISNHDLCNNLQALPRYDCNEFPYGKASVGTKTN